MTTVTVNMPVAVVAPRGAALAASIWLTVSSGLTLWRHTRRSRHAAAGRVAEAANLRAYAWGIMHQDRGYAADLLAAADRHELD
jgi:hypothetical protein